MVAEVPLAGLSFRHPARGRIALQAHGGGVPQDYAGKFVRYRGVRVREITAGK
jgi:hypothetical protein